MKVRWSQTALAQLNEIFLYIYERNRSAARSVTARVEELASLLGEFPFIGHLTDEADVRILPVVRYPFAIFYTIDDAAGEVVILHVRHTAQESPQMSR
jgi:plasmid stabilization system protein ParE